MSGILKEGVQLGDNYVVKRLLGKGGMSLVWLAEGKRGERLAVKEPIIAGVSEEEVKRNIAFVEHEGIILKKFNHQHICKLYDIKKGRYKGFTTVLLFLEYLEGGSLRDINEPLDAYALKNVAVQILEGLAEVHKAGVVHRDIKPSNVMLSRGVYKLVDFGTAVYNFEKALHIVVSPGGYTAPEQLLTGLVTPQADVWSVGATLVWAFTKQHPYIFIRGYDVDRIKGELRVELPSTGYDLLDRFLAKALEPDYKQRFKDAMDALNFLKGVAVKERSGLVLRVDANDIHLSQAQIIIGRTEDPHDHLKVEGSMLYIYDPNRYISRQHVEIIEHYGKWFIRDLGSVNRTGLYRDGRWYMVWRGRQAVSDWVEIQNGDIIALGYDDVKGPYKQIYVQIT